MRAVLWGAVRRGNSYGIEGYCLKGRCGGEENGENPKGQLEQTAF